MKRDQRGGKDEKMKKVRHEEKTQHEKKKLQYENSTSL